MDLSYKAVPFECEFKNLGDGKPTTFEGEASTFGNTDLVGDIIAKGAFKKSLKKINPKLLWQHSHSELIGGFDQVRETDTGLFVKGRLTKGVQRADEAALLLKDGVLDSMSIGFEVLDMDRMKSSNLIKQVNLYEVSLVTFPANPMATVSSVKSVVPFKDYPIADRGTKWSASEGNDRVRKFTKSEEGPVNPAYKNAFMWFDAEKPASFGSYKLQFVDVIDNALKVVPQALFAVVAAIQGARGGLDVPEKDLDGIKAHVLKYYKKLGLDDPFTKGKGLIVDVDRAKLISNKRDFEKALRDSGVFSKEAAIILASQFQPRQSESASSENKIKAMYGDILPMLERLVKDEIHSLR
jgi:HK97 family phage prohead protease